MFGADTLPGFLPSLFWGIITISILVFVHEAGHALAARALGLKVTEFFIGLPGPKISFKIGETRYGVTAIPFGGYVRIPALEGSGPAAELGLMSDEERAELGDIPMWKRIVVLSAGIVTNLVVAIVILTILLSTAGLPTDQGYVSPVSGGPAAAAGLPDQARVLSIDGVPVETFGELADFVQTQDAGDTVTVVYQVDGGESQSLDIVLAERPSEPDVPAIDDPDAANTGGDVDANQDVDTAAPVSPHDNLPPVYMGVAPYMIFQPLPIGDSFMHAIRHIGLIAEAISRLFNPATFQEVVDQSASIIGMSVMSAQAAQTGIMNYAFLVASISISLGLMNLLPIPPLDGGKIVLELIQRAMRRPVPQSIQVGLSMFGICLLLVFMFYVMFQDVLRLAG